MHVAHFKRFCIVENRKQLADMSALQNYQLEKATHIRDIKDSVHTRTHIKTLLTATEFVHFCKIL